MKKAILFDMDGILLDSELYYREGTIEWLTQAGFKGDFKILDTLIGLNMKQTYELLRKFLDNRYTIEEVIKLNETYFTTHPIDFNRYMFAGVKEILTKAKQEGYKLAVCSSSTKPMILANLQGMEIIDFFDVILSSDEFEIPKPNPEIYLHAMEKLNLKAKDCVIYEDSKIGIEAAKASGCLTVARIDNRFGQDQSEADILVKDIYEFYQVIKGK